MQKLDAHPDWANAPALLRSANGCRFRSLPSLHSRTGAVAWDQIPAPIPARQVKPVQAAPRRNKTVTPKADHPWRHNDRKMAHGGTTGMPLADAIRVAGSSTSP